MKENYPDISTALSLCSKMDSKRPEYEKEIRNSQELLKGIGVELKDRGDDYSICYSGMIDKSISEWWDWINKSKQISLF